MICDYGAGALRGEVKDTIIATLSARPSSLLAVVDAHDPRSWAALRPDLATPNAQEAAVLLGLKLESPGRPAVVVGHREELLGATGAAAVVVTLDREGSILLPATGDVHRTWANPSRRSRRPGRGIPSSPCSDPGPGRLAAADHERGPCPGGGRHCGPPARNLRVQHGRPHPLPGQFR